MHAIVEGARDVAMKGAMSPVVMMTLGALVAVAMPCFSTDSVCLMLVYEVGTVVAVMFCVIIVAAAWHTLPMKQVWASLWSCTVLLACTFRYSWLRPHRPSEPPEWVGFSCRWLRTVQLLPPAIAPPRHCLAIPCVPIPTPDYSSTLLSVPLTAHTVTCGKPGMV